MTKLFKNKYRVESTRMKGWDYSRSAYYFVTICAKDCKCYFGKIVEDEVILSEIGKIVLNEWSKTKDIRKNVVLDEMVIMPNHLHVIIGIAGNGNGVETHCNASLPTANNLFVPADNNYKNEFGPQKNNLSSIIRGFKGSAKKQINEIYGENFFNWQPRFYDHIIRNEISLNKVRKYIIDNPFRWHLDKNNPEGLWM